MGLGGSKESERRTQAPASGVIGRALAGSLFKSKRPADCLVVVSSNKPLYRYGQIEGSYTNCPFDSDGARVIDFSSECNASLKLLESDHSLF